MHATVHVIDTARLDEDDEVFPIYTSLHHIQYLMKQLTQNSVVWKKRYKHHCTTCRKKKGVTCLFSAPWVPPQRNLVLSRGKDIDISVFAKCKNVLHLVFHQFTQIDNLQDIILCKVLGGCNVTEGKYYKAVKNDVSHL